MRRALFFSSVSPRLLLAVLPLLAACAPRTDATEFVSAKVTWEAGVQATCFVVTATSTLASGGTDTRRSEPMARPTGKDSLTVAIFRDGRGDTVTLQALGFSDAACTAATGEESDAVEVSFHAEPGREPRALLVRVAPPNLDLDGDGVPTPDDCDDGNPAVAPGKAETCADDLDNDCNGDVDCADSACAAQACAVGALCRGAACAEASCDDLVDNDGDGPVDCADGDCAGQPCGVGGTCMGAMCRGTTEALCTDGLDNDGDQAIDCADPDCAARACTDGDGCTAGETCSGGVCGGGLAKDCAQGLPVCLVNAGCDAGVCLAAPAPGTTACDDGDPCTTGERCDGDGGCAGTPTNCGTPPGPCFGAGTCQAALDGGCTWPVVTSNTCSDGNGCTVADACQADGGCTGTPLDCATPPAECLAWANTCTAGACDFAPRAGACDGGTCSNGACVPAGTVTWPYAPSNFNPATLDPDAGPALAVSCASAVLDTGGPAAPTFTPSGCSTGSTASLPMTVVTQPVGGGEVVLVTGAGFSLDAGATLRVVGTRPVLFAIRGDVTLAGQLLAGASGGRPGAGADPVGGCAGATGGNGLPDVSSTANGGAGAGGGAFGSAGARGANAGGTSGAPGDGGLPVGTAALVPLRGGCSGGRGGYSATGSVFGAPGLAGGAVQVSATGTLRVRGTVGAPGAGGGAGPGDTAGAGGGGSGGAILLEASSLVLTPSARVLALGGGGGEGAGDDPGNGGSAGAAGSLTADVVAAGGSGGSSRGGEGGAGASSTVAAVAGSAGTVSGGPGGGGAGGAGLGRVRFNVTGACTFESGAVVAPPQSTPDGGCR